MPLYRFVAVTGKRGKTVGTVDADSLHEAKLKLIRRQIAAIQVELLQEKQLQVTLKKKELLSLTTELARLLEAGLPLFESLCALEEKYRNLQGHCLLLDLLDQVRAGHSLSSSLKRHPQVFDLLYIAMIANAEKTGRLSHAFNELSRLLSAQIQIRKQIVSALLYPGLLACFCLVILGSLLFFVVPSLQELFEGKSLHPFTKVVFALSSFACKMKGVFLAVLIACILGAFAFGKKRAQALVRKLPWTRTLLAKTAFVRFCRAVATLLEGGIPAIAAFAQGKAVLHHAELEKVILDAEKKILQGEALHIPFQNHPLIPPLVPRMIAIAQQGGNLSLMMRHIAEIYEEELDAYLLRFASLAQPILLLILGGLIGFVLLAVLLPLTDVSAFVS